MDGAEATLAIRKHYPHIQVIALTSFKEDDLVQGVLSAGAIGYLLDEFLRDGANQRSGPYGGCVENRARLLFEVVEAVSAVWGSDRVGLRISPVNSYNSMIDSDPVGLATFLAGRLNDFKLAYLHAMRGDFFGLQKGDVMTPIRAHYRGVLIANMGYSARPATRRRRWPTSRPRWTMTRRWPRPDPASGGVTAPVRPSSSPGAGTCPCPFRNPRSLHRLRR